jgi:hypothetical protein
MFIDCYITACNLNISWYAFGIYGYPYHPQKHLTCEIIKDLSYNRNTSNWQVFGDFNLILNSSEKLGGNNIDYNHTKMFNDTLNDCELTDLGYDGTKFTWANSQPDNIHIKERLYRFCANSNWISSFPRFINKHLLRYTSDHNPILLEFSEVSEFINTHKRAKPIIFEQLWAQEQESQQIVKSAWSSSYGNSPNKLNHTLHRLHNWGKTKFGDIPF